MPRSCGFRWPQRAGTLYAAWGSNSFGVNFPPGWDVQSFSFFAIPGAYYLISTSPRVMNQVTSILASIDRGEPQAAEKLLPLVYDELRKLARAKMANQPSGHTLQATALVHEAWIRLVGPDGRIGQEWDSRGHFFAAAAESMRRILIEHARRKASLKRGGQMKRIDLEDAKLATNTEPDVLLAIHEALEKLKKEDETNYQLISLRFFAGLRMVEIAKILGVSPATAKRKWSYARAWLFREILAAEKELE